MADEPKAMGLIVKLKEGRDVRTVGSGNAGATNVLRSGNKKAAIATLLFDALKGYFPVLLVKLYGPAFGLDDQAVALVAISAFIGHLWPVFFAFKGGKGVATALGVLVGISGWLGLVLGLLWLAVAAVSRYSSLASLAAAVLAPVIYVLASGPLWYSERSIVAAIVVMSALLAWRHKENIARLIQGKESRLGKGKSQPAAAATPEVAKTKKHHKRH